MLLIRGWDVEEFNVDGGGDGGGGGIEITGCNDGGGDLAVDTGAIEVEVFNCDIGGGGEVVLVPEPTTIYKL